MHVRSCLYSAELFFAVVDAVAWSLLKALFTLYQIAFAQARKPYRTVLLFIHKIDDFGAILVTGRSYAAPISNTLEGHMSNRFWPLHFFGPSRKWIRSGEDCNPLRRNKYSGVRFGTSFTKLALGQPLRYDVRCMWATCSGPGQLLFLLHLYLITFCVEMKRYPVWREHCLSSL